jgi:ribA/ribD-fused uncharacterized protein
MTELPRSPEERHYDPAASIVFRRTREEFGGLSNMAAGYPLIVNGYRFRTPEALYQACRYPHLPEVQRAIADEISPMSAKMKSKARYADSRPDWEDVRISVMRWCLRVKLAQHFLRFGFLLEETGCLDIVEFSRKDPFWGAKPQADGTLVGVNALGRLLMQLRARYRSQHRYELLFVPPIRLTNFDLFGRVIEPVDCRHEFIVFLLERWFGNHMSDRGAPTLSVSEMRGMLDGRALGVPADWLARLYFEQHVLYGRVDIPQESLDPAPGTQQPQPDSDIDPAQVALALE